MQFTSFGKQIMHALSQAVFPPSARSEAVYAQSPETYARHIQMHTFRLPNGVRGIGCFSYRTTDIRECLRALKFDRARTVADTIMCAAHEDIVSYLIDECGITESPMTLIPVPLSRARFAARGHNQAALLARALEKQSTGIFSVHNALRREDRPSQSRIQHAQRAQNIAGAFSCTHPDAIAGYDVILLDDIATSGHTLADAYRALQSARPRRIIPLAIATASSSR